MSSASSSPPTRSREQGFTLLEVLVAFAILAGLTAWLSVNFVENVQKGVTALSNRELREAADTIFRKMIYETEEYEDGKSGTLDDEYGEFARLKGWQRDRWQVYRYELEKKLAAVGSQTEDSEEMLIESEGSTSSDDTSSSTGSRSDDTSSDSDAEGVPKGIELMRMTLKIYRTDREDGDNQALMVLTTYYDPNRGKVTR